MRLETRYLAGGALILLAVVAIACSGGPKAEAPPPTPTPGPADIEGAGVEEEEITKPVTETLSSEKVTSEELPEDLEILNARGYLEDVFFDTDRFDLTPEARGALAKNSNWLLEYSSIMVLIEGHCDERNTREYNLALGERRANAVRDYLMSLGVSSDRIRTISYGEERPFALGHTEESWRLNRRAHFVITAR